MGPRLQLNNIYFNPNNLPTQTVRKLVLQTSDQEDEIEQWLIKELNTKDPIVRIQRNVAKSRPYPLAD